MKNNGIPVIFDARRGAATAAWSDQMPVQASPAAPANVPPGLRSNVVALPVADGHHAYLSSVASSTRAP